jgi:hypothetical protein
MADTNAATASVDRAALPFTCQYCRNTLADHLLIYELYVKGVFSQRVKDLVCEGCGTYGLPLVSEHGPSFRAARLFRLALVEP